MTRTIARTCSFLALAFLAGCGDGLGARHPVEGTVKVGDQPLAGAKLTFWPASGKGAGNITGQSGPDGRYRMTTNGKPGVPAGKYKVTVHMAPPTTTEADPSKIGPSGSNPPPRPFNARYDDQTRTDLSVDVPGTNFDLRLDR